MTSSKLTLLSLAVLLAGCEPAQVCVASHTETTPAHTSMDYVPFRGMQMGTAGVGSYRLVHHPETTEEVCDNWQPNT